MLKRYNIKFHSLSYCFKRHVQKNMEIKISVSKHSTIKKKKTVYLTKNSKMKELRFWTTKK